MARPLAPPAPSRLLCIEDDDETRALLAEALAEHGFLVETASTGQEGYAAILRITPDLVLCDVGMPDMSGFEVLEKLAGLNPLYDAIPFVFLTALTDRENVLKGRRLGADDYVTKPIDFEVLVEIVRARLGRSSRSQHRPPSVRLSDREIEVLTWSARGKSSGDIAILIGVSERTVNFHIENAMRKLGVATRIQAAVQASAEGIIKP
jgi:DNA-binding NarL/FixJ family response regulator